MIYVCDRCGTTDTRDEIPEDTEWTCVCGSHAAWEFPDARRSDAMTHARHINRGYISLFRTANDLHA